MSDFPSEVYTVVPVGTRPDGHVSLLSLTILDGGCLWFRLNCDFNLGTLLQADLVTILVGQAIFNANLPVKMIGSFDGDLSLLGLAGRWGLDDLFDSCGQSSTWLFAHRVFPCLSRPAEYRVAAHLGKHAPYIFPRCTISTYS